LIAEPRRAAACYASRNLPATSWPGRTIIASIPSPCSRPAPGP